ncbi:hypothetical protein SOVF_191430 [Spinacia oleracea]|uniref:Pentatricopeptide repeat-containing protein CRR2, chloroplastic n=1 Tax=Spinacia oleracea TaxID=3562 RepID=A0A9R0JE43_SPIOL|nr:pentatricopeptide repeat-containing protein CRR2, chloroplastic [Spinacia oleracea]KNA05328.1 hypothetical protein SOVF_191430 [Spinacia oleracea]
MWVLHSPQIIQPPISPLQFNHRTASITAKPPSTTFICCFSTTSAAKSAVETTNKNSVIQLLCKKGNLKQALQLLSPESNLTQQTYELLILSCSLHKSFPDAFAVHRYLIANGFDEDPFLATKLIDMYTELECIEYARQVFDKIPRRTIYTWNAILRALTLAGYGVEALSIYREMNRIGMPCDRFTHTYALKACVVSESMTSLLKKGKEIHGQILRHGYETHVHIMTTLLDVYAKFGNVVHASYVFYAMADKNVVSWSAMIACYAKNERPLEALNLFHEMVYEISEFAPNSVTMVNVVQACAALGALEQGRVIHCYILRRNLNSILPVTSALMTMYARCGKLEIAQKIFDQMDNRDVVSWNTLISSYGIHGFGMKAVSIFKEMLNRGVKPTAISFVSVLGACSHAGLADVGKRLFNSMVEQHGISPSVEHYACLVDILGRANRLKEAAKVIQDMKMKPGPQVWGSLLGSCKIHCNVEFAERASAQLFKLEPTNAGNYVLLADIYAEARMWDEVKRVKQLLDTQGLEKVSGRSWIEVRRKIYSFTSVDELNPQIELIRALLAEFSGEMKQQGYIPQTQLVLYDLEEKEKERILLGHSEKLAVGFGLINTSKGETIRITKNLRLCQDCHTMTKFISRFTGREIMVRDINRIHHFHDGVCSCGDYP